MSRPAKVVARLPPSEPLLTNQGLPALSWLYFFQLLGRATDQVVAADLPTLVDQMLLDLVPLPVMPTAEDVLPSLQMPVRTVDVLPELAVPSLAIPDMLSEPGGAAALSLLAQRISDLELWSL